MNRQKIVSRHNPKVSKIDRYSPLSVGNGEFAFTADVTGLQTFPASYAGGIPLCTQSHWGWHTTPAKNASGRYTLDDLKYEEFEVHGRKVPYPTSHKGQEEVYNWLRENPHRLHLGRVGLEIEKDNGVLADACDIKNAQQELDLWQGVLSSEFEALDTNVNTQTLCHPSEDILAFQIDSKLFEKGNLGVIIAFPYGSHEKQAADWESEDKHTSEILMADENRCLIKRTLDDDVYFTDIRIETKADVNKKSAHEFIIKPSKSNRLLVTIRFSKVRIDDMPSYDTIKKDCVNHWASYWQTGGMIDFAKCKDERAHEIERRVVLSQYLLAVQCSGSLPPQESGLTFNSWYGKFHLEMHWWHEVQFAMWNKEKLFEKSLWWYESIIDKAKAAAKKQGYAGARWPKMADVDGNDSPSFIGPLLIWQQPHPIYYAELIYSVTKDEKTLEKYKDVVFQTAKFMASYAHYDEQTKRYVLGPAVIPSQENHKPMETLNPTFELEYWDFALSVANKWRERLGMERNAKWDEVCEKLSELPQKDGVYLAHENCPDTYTKFNFDHPTMIAALGFLPGKKADKQIMKNTMQKVFDDWNFGHVWGWDFPMMAMTCARLNMPNAAIDSLLYDAPKNEYLVSGHNKQGDKVDLPIYLPGNGGFLTAIAMMAAGWEGCKEKNPGFPKDGAWDIEWEGLNPML